MTAGGRSDVAPQASAPGRRIVNPWTWQDAFGFVQANEISGAVRTIFCAGQASVDHDGRPLHAGDLPRQLHLALDNLKKVLEAADAGMRHVVRLNYYTTDVQGLFGAWGTLVERLSLAECQPASTVLGVQALAYPELLVEIEATAVVPA